MIQVQRVAPVRAIEHVAGAGGQAVAAVAVVEAVAEAPDFRGAGRDGESGEIGEGGDRIVGRKHLPEPGEPARFLEMEVGDEQGAAAWPEQGPLRKRHQIVATERKANHGSRYSRARQGSRGQREGLGITEESSAGRRRGARSIRSGRRGGEQDRADDEAFGDENERVGERLQETHSRGLRLRR